MNEHSTTSCESAVGSDIVMEMRPSLLKYFRRKTGSTAEAEDLTHDVVVRALSHANWRSPDQAKGYIFRTAINRWRDVRRRRKTHGITLAWDESLIDQSGVENSAERVLMVREELNRILQALGEMSLRTRTVLILIKLEQMKIATVADMLGISVSAVNKHLARGLACLAELRDRQDGP